MAEPHTSVASGAVAGAGISLGGGMLLGAQIDALVVGLFGALFVTTWMMNFDSRFKAGSAVLLSSMLGGYGSPVAASWIAASVTGVGTAAPGLRLPMALLIAALTPILFPVIAARVKQLIEVGKP